MLKTCILGIAAFAMSGSLAAQNIVTYAGNAEKETFNDVVQLSDRTILVAGAADDLSWLNPSINVVSLSATGINNTNGTGMTGFLLQFSADLQTILGAWAFPDGAVEDIRYIKTTNRPGDGPTGDIYISGSTLDSRANDGGYFIARLNGNFVDAAPTGLDWSKPIWAEGYVKDNHPWDVGSDGKVVYVTGQSHANDWAALHRLNAQGQREVVPMWRQHWIIGGGEHRDVAATAPGGVSSLDYSGVVLKESRCDLRSWSQADYDLSQPDENGGTKKGKWPLDVFYTGPCNPLAPSFPNPGYTGYSTGSTSVHGPSSVVVDRRDGSFYLGMNIKSVLPDGQPDFEPAVVKMDAAGELKWWSRLYHEITPGGDTTNSTPDQYVDGLAIDYTNDFLVVDARCHGNNVENLWEGDVIAANLNANGFQNRFTGTSGNIHISWLGKLKTTDGILQHSTYVAEYAEGTGGLGSPHPDPNLDGWPNPNGGWPNVNTTRLAKNALKVSAAGWVVTAGVGRRTITTANAYQKMVKPGGAGLSSWNNFVRVYEDDFSVPLYSSLVVGVWDTLTQQGGDNTTLFNVFKTVDGVLAVGLHKEDANTPGLAKGNPIPTTNVPAWGSATPAGQSAILVHYRAANLNDPLDDPFFQAVGNAPTRIPAIQVFPNPNNGQFKVRWEATGDVVLEVRDLAGRLVQVQSHTNLQSTTLDISQQPKGVYLLEVKTESGVARSKVILK
jgi:hypothetical protein